MATKKLKAPAKKPTKRAPKEPDSVDAMRIVREMRGRAMQAYHDAYHEQEKRTVDSTVKRAVAAALQHMLMRTLDEPYTPPPPTLFDASVMAEQMQLDFVRQLRDRLKHRSGVIDAFIEVARASSLTDVPLNPDTMTAIAEVLELFLAMPQLDIPRSALVPVAVKGT